MSKFNIGDVVSVEFPFFDLQTHKRRPGLVLMICDPDLVVARVTTHPPRDDSDVALQRWSEAGLPRSSTVRLKKLATIDNRLIHHTIGHLEWDDAHLIAQSWQRMAAALGGELQV